MEVLILNKKALIITIVVVIMFVIFFKGCFSQSLEIQADDIELSAIIRSFSNDCEYKIYMGTSETMHMKNTIHIDIYWELINKALIDVNKIFYPPYIIIVHPNERWTFLGSNQNMPRLYGVRTSMKQEVIKAVFDDNNTYDWRNIDIIGIHTRMKSFGQGYVTFSYYKDNLCSEDIESFFIYLIYYDPNVNKGWYKMVQEEPLL